MRALGGLRRRTHECAFRVLHGLPQPGHKVFADLAAGRVVQNFGCGRQRVFGDEDDIPDAPAQPAARRNYNNDVPAFLRRNKK